jgi:hypothetical protein
MMDFLIHEQLFFACLLHNKPAVIRLQFVRVSNANNLRSNPWLVALNEKGTEQAFPLKYCFKFRPDAEAKAEELQHRGRSR